MSLEQPDPEVAAPSIHRSEGTKDRRCPWWHKHQKVVLGIVLVILIAVSQVGASQFAKSTYRPGFNAPFFITWFNASWLTICYPIYILCNMVANCFYRQKTLMETWKRSQSVYGPEGLTLKRFVTIGGSFAVMAVGTNYIYLRALGVLKPSDVTALFASNSVFVFLLSCLLLGSQIISLKVISVILAVTGIVLIAHSDGFQGPSMVGVALAVAAALGAACYIVMFKRVVGNATPDQVSLFLSVTALFTALCFWPVILVLHFTGVEVITKDIPWVFMAGSCSLSIVFNFLLNFGTAYTYPLFIAFGGIMGVPLNHVADWLFRENVFDVTKVVGTVLIIIAFVIIVALPAKVDKQFHDLVTSCSKKTETLEIAADELEQLRPADPDLARTSNGR